MGGLGKGATGGSWGRSADGPQAIRVESSYQSVVFLGQCVPIRVSKVAERWSLPPAAYVATINVVDALGPFARLSFPSIVVATGTLPHQQHVVFVTSGLVARRKACLEFASRLSEAGFRVTYASPDDIGGHVESRGLPFLRLSGQETAPDTRRSTIARIARLTRVRMRLRAEADALGVGPGLARLAELSPDLILIDLELHPYIIAAHGLDAPVALLSTWLSIWKRPGLAPLHRYLVPGPGPRGALAAEWAWFRYRVWKGLRRRLAWVKRAGTDSVNVLRELARRHGFSFRKEIDLWQWQNPFSYRRLPYLVLNASEVDLPHASIPRIRYVGPMLRSPEPGDANEPIESLLARRNKARPLVYVSFGTFFKGDDSTFVRRLLGALEDRPDWDVVLGLGGRMDPDALAPFPSHVHAFAWVPQARVISQADAALLHAGISSINECLMFGVPMVVYPLDTNDQMGTAARVAFHGLGIVGDRVRDDAAAMRANIERVLTSPDFARRSAEMGDRLRRYEQDGVAIEAVKELLAAV